MNTRITVPPEGTCAGKATLVDVSGDPIGCGCLGSNGPASVDGATGQSNARAVMLDLDEIEKRAAAATPGRLIVEPYVDETGRRAWLVCSGASGAVLAGGFKSEADAEFVAHAREDVSALVAEVRRLRVQAVDMLNACDMGYPCGCYARATAVFERTRGRERLLGDTGEQGDVVVRLVAAALDACDHEPPGPQAEGRVSDLIERGAICPATGREHFAVEEG